MSQARKCRECNNMTKNPSGACYLHEGGSTLSSRRNKLKSPGVAPSVQGIMEARYREDVEKWLGSEGYPPGAVIDEDERSISWEVPQLEGADRQFNDMGIVAQSKAFLEDGDDVSVFDDEKVVVGIYREDACWMSDEIDLSGIPHEMDGHGVFVVDQDHLPDAVTALRSGVERHNYSVRNGYGINADLTRAKYGIGDNVGVTIAGSDSSHPRSVITGSGVEDANAKTIEWYDKGHHYITKFDAQERPGEHLATTWEVTRAGDIGPDGRRHVAVSDDNRVSQRSVRTFESAVLAIREGPSQSGASDATISSDSMEATIMSESRKCQECNRETTDPSGLCHLHRSRSSRTIAGAGVQVMPTSDETPMAWDGLTDVELELVHVFDGPENPDTGERDMNSDEVKAMNRTAITTGRSHPQYRQFVDLGHQELDRIERQLDRGIVPGSADRVVTADWVAANLGWNLGRVSEGESRPLDPEEEEQMKNALIAWVRGRWEWRTENP